MRTVTLIISGGIAAYKALELIRLLKKDGFRVLPVLTKGGAAFVTPLSVATLAEEKVYGELFSLTDEAEMGHIRLSRMADLVVVAPASADLIAKLAHGRADDLASALLLASDKPVLVAPAMNPQMWAAKPTQKNISEIRANGALLVGPVAGDTACGEEGTGRMAEPEEIFAAIRKYFAIPGPLAGKRALVTAGPTIEPIDPVRFISNYSSGKQGYAIAEALSEAGADVTLISGPTSLQPAANVRLVRVKTADDMLAAAESVLPTDIAICTAAVADWKVEISAQKIKKDKAPELHFQKNPDILAHLSHHRQRPRLVVGFAAETQDLEGAAARKRDAKGVDWILANDVSKPVFGADDTELSFVSKDGAESWGRMGKMDAARMLVGRIAKEMRG